MSICKFEGCLNKTLAKGLCAGHYRQKFVKGQTLKPINLVEYDASFCFSFSLEDFNKLKELANLKGKSISEMVRSIMKKNLEGEPRKLEVKTDKFNRQGRENIIHRKQVLIRLSSSMKKSVKERASQEGVSVRRFVTEDL